MDKECKRTIDNGGVKNQAELTRLKDISRARVTQILNLLNLDSTIIRKLEKFDNPLKSNIITDRMLRLYVNKSKQ